MERERKHLELYAQLGTWFDAETTWRTRTSFAESIGLPITTVEHYFRGGAFPRGADRLKLYEATHITCLAPGDKQPGLFEGKTPEDPPARQPTQAASAPVQSSSVKSNDAEPDEEPYKTIRIAVSGDVTLRRLETAIIDTREFQRLRALKQLGTSYLVYPSAVHTRFEHSLGTLFEASRMIEYVKNNPKSEGIQKRVEPREEILIRLAALLHDVSHVPFGHTLEDEACVVSPRHDEDQNRRQLLIEDSDIGKKIVAAIGKDDFDLLLKVIGTKHEEVETLDRYAYISDVVNNTLCADLLDYLKRDVYFCNLQESFSDRFLRYLYLDLVDVEADKDKGEATPKRARRLIVRLWKREYGRHRRDVLSELCSLLRIRYSLGEKVYFHHAKNSSSAMLARAVWAAMHSETGHKMKAQDLYNIGDDQLLARLAESKDPIASRLGDNLLKRSLYKWVYTLTRNEAEAVPSFNWTQRMIDEFHKEPKNRVEVEDQLASLSGLNPGDVM